jgi:alanine-glyoxylate transaminase / serine-glyoxylate transaminase / serine-pyruvate transaminase
MDVRDLNPPERLLLGPGPSNVSLRIMKALGSPIVGHLDPYFLQVMDESQILLREVFKTRNKLTLPLSGTGMAGMEATLSNVVEAGDEVVVGVNGFFSERMCEVITRLGGKPIRVEAEWGTIIEREAIDDALKRSKARIMAMVHAETSTGILQPVKEISELAKKYDAILLLDAVTSLGGCELEIDGWGVDICYSGTQKCLNCPPGLSPVTINDRALNLIANRRTKVSSYYMDLTQIARYWSEERVYHHTAPILMVYALREALRIVLEEGLEARWTRHKRNSSALIAGIEAMGMRMHAQKNYRLPSLNTVTIPGGITDANIRKRLLDDFNIEIGGGLGALKGKIWRIGLMGINSSEKNVINVLEALDRAMTREGAIVKLGEGVRAAAEYYSTA